VPSIASVPGSDTPSTGVLISVWLLPTSWLPLVRLASNSWVMLNGAKSLTASVPEAWEKASAIWVVVKLKVSIGAPGPSVALLAPCRFTASLKNVYVGERRAYPGLHGAGGGSGGAIDGCGEIGIADGGLDMPRATARVDDVERGRVENVQRAGIGRGSNRGLRGAVELDTAEGLRGEAGPSR